VRALSDDFSMTASLARLKKAQPLGGVEPVVNPHSEQTLKSNAENDYCRSHHYELVRHLYTAELAAYWDWVFGRMASGAKTPWQRPADASPRAKAMKDRCYATPLAEMAPTDKEKTKPLADVLVGLEATVRQSLAAKPQFPPWVREVQMMRAGVAWSFACVLAVAATARRFTAAVTGAW
jgi:hypothetical protein